MDEPKCPDLEETLELTLQHLRAGDLAALEWLASATDAAFSALDPLDDPQQAARLQALAERNLRCLAAAARGVRSARRRLVEVAAARSGLQSYDDAGRPRRIGGSESVFKHRV